MAGWFGPTGDCGCSCVIPCECSSDGSTGSCVPSPPGYFQNLAIEISEVPNEIFRLDSGIDLACTSRTCRPTEDLLSSYDYRYTGFAAINGTYPITFLQYDAIADEYFESDPKNGCGFWSTTDITFEIRFEEIQSDEYLSTGSTPPCNVRYRQGHATLNLVWNPFLNSFSKPTYPITLTTSTFLFPDRNEPLIPRYASGTFTLTGTTTQPGCNGGGVSTNTPAVNSNDPIASIVTGTPLVGALVADPFGGGGGVTPPGLASGLPKSPPAGTTIVNSQFCNINRIESFAQYEDKTFVTLDTTGDCGLYREIRYGGWQVRRKLVYTGVS